MTLKDSNLKIGIVGTNFISDSFCEAAKAIGLELAAVYSRNAETAECFTKKHSIKNSFCDFQEFCCSGKINAAYIASPIACHYQQSKALLQHGKHVLCEKTITSNLAEFKVLRRLAGEKNLILLEAMRPAFDPVYNTIRQNIARCGKIRRAYFNFSQYSSRYDKYKNGITENAFNPELSNAAVMDIGVYCTYLCAMYFGRPDSIISRSVKLANGFEGQGEAILGYGDMTVNIVYSKIAQSHSDSTILGEDGELSFGHALPKINKLVFASKSGEKIDIPLNAAQNNMVYEIYEFERFISQGAGNEKYLDASEISLEIVDEIRRQNGIIFPADNLR